jgi:hypothetical protein
MIYVITLATDQKEKGAGTNPTPFINPKSNYQH